MRKSTSHVAATERPTRLCFKLRFYTRFGQSLYLTGNHALLGNGDFEKAVPLEYVNDEFWQATLSWPADACGVTYNYVLREADGSLIYDWGSDRVIDPASFTTENVQIIDAWNTAAFYENAFYTEPFKEVLLKGNHTELKTAAPNAATHTFKVKSPLLKKGQTVCLLGSSHALGNWNPVTPVLLSRGKDEDYFSAQVVLGTEAVEYSYGVYDVENATFVQFEAGAKRHLREPSPARSHTIVNDGFVVLPADTWKGAGVAIPVFSLRSETSFGVGEFTDLKLLVDWCRQTGLKLVQILPVNDTRATHTWVDSYPYAAISAFALHPLYLNLEQVAFGKNKRLLLKLEDIRKRLNELDAVDYDSVMLAKIAFVREIFPSQKDRTFRSKAFRTFFEANQHWLTPYAVFCYLRDKHGTCDFNQWPTHSRFDADEIAALAAESSPVWDEIAVNYFIQFHLHLQLSEAAKYAHANGIIVKGDIAIGVYRYGADAWQQPELYHMDMQAGAPPDAFAVKGQNWGFPTYNWPKMMEDGFAWWKRRFAQMSCYFDAFRIDHILGFFRIWSIPASAVEGILGHFVPAIAVEAGEFASRGIAFDTARYTQPYITDRILSEIFGSQLDSVKEQFLASGTHGNWTVKPEFATQRQVERYFATLEQNEANNRLKRGLYDLISNVILFAAEGNRYHFRFSMEDTLSYQSLDAATRAGLKALYIDYFFRRQDDFWRKEAMQKLPALKRVTNMLVCGEDLGLVPACVPEVMTALGLLSLEIQRMPKAMNQEFFRPKDAPYLSVVTPSTHDMSTVRGWWEEDRALTQKFYNQELGWQGEAPASCEPWVNQAIIEQHLASPAMWSIFQLQDLLGMDAELRRQNPADERINIPAITGYYWRYRMHLTLEKLKQCQPFNDNLKDALKRNGRG